MFASLGCRSCAYWLVGCKGHLVAHLVSTEEGQLKLGSQMHLTCRCTGLADTLCQLLIECVGHTSGQGCMSGVARGGLGGEEGGCEHAVSFCL